MKIPAISSYSAWAPKKNAKCAPSFNGISVNPYKMQEIDENTLNNRTLKDYIGVKDPYRQFEKAGNPNSNLIYIAEPREAISKETFNKHAYIVKDVEPPMPSLEQLEEKYKSRKAQDYDYTRDVQLIHNYNLRLYDVTKNNIAKAKDDYEQYQKASIDFDKYQYCRPSDIIKQYEEALNYQKNIDKNNETKANTINKIDMTKNLLKVLSDSAEDFKKRDMLAERIEYIDETYPVVEKKLKDIEVEKYLVDERIENLKKEIERVSELREEEAKKCGPTYNQSYPPSSLYYWETSLRNERRDKIEKSPKLQEMYDEYLDLKNNGPQRREAAEAELNELLEKMSKDFEKIKSIYEEYVTIDL